MIDQRSPRVEQVIQILDLLPKLPQPNGDFSAVELLTPDEITEVIRYLKEEGHNPGLVAHIWRARQMFPEEWKFDLRQSFLGLVVAILIAQAQAQTPTQVQTQDEAPKPRKLHVLDEEP